MLKLIKEALASWHTSGAVIVNDPKDNNLSIETMDGQVFVQVKKEMDAGQILDLCSVDADDVAETMAKLVATKMCSLIHNGMGGLVTQLDLNCINLGLNHANSAEIEGYINSQRDMMLDYVLRDLVHLPVEELTKIQRGEE